MVKKKGKRPNPTWSQVQLEGKVFSHDNATFEGFSGLEVLENYDSRLVKKEKQQRDSLNLAHVDRLPKAKKPELKKKVKEDSGVESEDDIFAQFDEDDYVPPPKKPKDEEKPKKSEKKKKESAAGRFVLLRPPTLESEEEVNGEDLELEGLGSDVENKNSDDDDFQSEENDFHEDELELSDGEKVLSNTSDLEEETVPNLINVKSWQELGVSEPILKAIADKGFTCPTEIQSQTIPAAMFGKRDILGAAETGSGKTLAFGIPIINGILKQREREETKSKKLFAVVLTPTRELASQIHDHLKDICKYTDIKVAPIFGGLSVVKQRRVLKQFPEIVIATPGRLWELVEEGEEHLQKISEIPYFVVDETDRMVEKGHFEEMQKLLTLLNDEEENAKNRQNFIFSATLTMVHDLPDYVLKKSRGGDRPLKSTPGQKIQQLIEAFGVKNPKIVDITSSTGTAKSLTECRILCQTSEKDVYLYYFLQKHPGRTIVFCNSIECVKRLVSLLGYLTCQPYGLHGNMAQKQRLKNIDRFKANPNGLLIATDVAARGLDIPLVQHVIHYQTPKTTENYVHRSGRTARANNEGIAVLIMDPSEVKYYKKLYQDLGRVEDLPLFPTLDKSFKIARDRVYLAQEVEKMDLHMRREAMEENWSKKIAREAELETEDSEADSDDEIVKRSAQTKNKQKFREQSLQLAQLLAMPMFGSVSKYPTSLNSNSSFKNKYAAENETAIDSVKQVVAEHKEWKKNRNKKRKYK